MHIFYTPLIQIDNAHFLLDEEESKHAVRVLRLQAGDCVILVDGRGNRFEAVIQDNHPKRVVLQIESVQEHYGERSYYLHIAIAPTKNLERLEWFLEKATEIGIDEITPILCDHSERKEVKLDRLHKILVSAMKQSQKAYLPKLNPMVKLDQFMVQQTGNDTLHRFIAHCAEDEKGFLPQFLKGGESVCVLIGPEGDFSPAEIRKAKEAGFKATSLGDSRLRTETAGVVSTLEVQLINRQLS